MIGGEVEIIHRTGDVEIAVRVEALDEDRALMTQIAFHLEIGVETEGDRGAILQLAAELPVQRAVGKIGDVRGHPRDGKAAARERTVAEIDAALPFRIGQDDAIALVWQRRLARAEFGLTRDAASFLRILLLTPLFSDE